MIVAGIDIGSNTILMVIADVASDGTLHVLEEHHALPRLGEGITSGLGIGAEALGRALEVLRSYRQHLDRYHSPPARCVATSAVRDAVNRFDVVSAFTQALGVPVDVIDGATEGALTFSGAAADLPGEVLLCDIGGGSTELVLGLGGAVQSRVSLNLGAVRHAERWCTTRPVEAQARESLRSDIRHTLASVQLPQLSKHSTFVGVAGTPVAAAMLIRGLVTYDRDAVEGTILTLSQVHALAEQLLSLSYAELAELPGIDPSRSDILPVGVTVLDEIMQYVRAEHVLVRTRGLRYGALVEAYRQARR